MRYQRPHAAVKIVRFRRGLVLSMTLAPVRSGMPKHFGIRITQAENDKLVGELDVDDRHLNNSGHVHGGALAAFADDLGGTLAGLNVPPGFRTTTIESKTNIFRACVPGRVTGVAVPVHVGRRMIVLQISIYRPDGKLAAMMILTQMVLRRESSTPFGWKGAATLDFLTTIAPLGRHTI